MADPVVRHGEPRSRAGRCGDRNLLSALSRRVVDFEFFSPQHIVAIRLTIRGDIASANPCGPQGNAAKLVDLRSTPRGRTIARAGTTCLGP